MTQVLYAIMYSELTNANIYSDYVCLRHVVSSAYCTCCEQCLLHICCEQCLLHMCCSFLHLPIITFYISVNHSCVGPVKGALGKYLGFTTGEEPVKVDWTHGKNERGTVDEESGWA